MSIFEKINPIQVAAIVFPSICVFGSQYLGAGASDLTASDFINEGTEFEQSQFDFKVNTEMESFTHDVMSPFYFERVDFESDPYEESELEPNPYGNQNSTEIEPEFSVTAILPNAKNPLAIVDGKPRRVGDTLESGWTVLAINGDDFSVTLRHRSGKSTRVTMKKTP